MQHEITHSLATPAVKKALERAMAYYAKRYAKYQPHLHWTGQDAAEVSLTALGVTLKGKVALIPQVVRLTANVPLVLRPFMKKALAVLDREVHRWLGDSEPSAT